MIASIRIENPEDIKLSLSMTLPLKDWKRLREQLKNSGSVSPAWEVARIIDELVGKANLSIDHTREVIQ